MNSTLTVRTDEQARAASTVMMPTGCRGRVRALLHSVGLAAVASLAVMLPVASKAATATKTLVLYDTAGRYGYLGELYAIMVANLAGHFGTATTEPVSAYKSQQIASYTSVVYIGSTYYGATDTNGAIIPDAIPKAFYTDVQAAKSPVIWIGYNIWNMANSVGVATFKTKYGWDPTRSSIYAPHTSQVTYKGQTINRTVPATDDGGIVNPSISNASLVTVLAQAQNTGTTPATSVPWAIRSSNITYLGEIPFDYATEADRVVIFSDLMFDALAPTTPTQHRALARLEDINPAEDPGEVMAAASYLYSQNVPFGFGVIPYYTDPQGYYNNGTPQTIPLAQATQLVSTLRWMTAHGGVMIDHGYTHQYSNVNNPFDGVSGDDFEFFLAHVTPQHTVAFDGPPPVDSTAWAQSRVFSALLNFQFAGLARPTIWETPHYFGSYYDSKVFVANYKARYERPLYWSGMLSGGTINPQIYVGQFFPYAVTDVYGGKVIPENLANYEPVAFYGVPPRLPADILNEAKANLVVRDGFASFFYHPYYGTSALSQIVQGIKGLGYKFVSPTSLL